MVGRMQLDAKTRWRWQSLKSVGRSLEGEMSVMVCYGVSAIHHDLCIVTIVGAYQLWTGVWDGGKLSPGQSASVLEIASVLARALDVLTPKSLPTRRQKGQRIRRDPSSPNRTSRAATENTHTLTLIPVEQVAEPRRKHGWPLKEQRYGSAICQDPWQVEYLEQVV
ncbi:hypothetical protein AXG93_4123s1220 [Marchantia polymorpha subsp. ruderalis]|uniref:Uncharacterized protein n=1 Tax=Marchantia polymorpha subsp. ruderalis TaxID=1480154 RepID=A0A176WJM1_MARPO|nr:hypothetical protein AXG93_4123s1220 [Marchantia polymorpha subsp. ruderalis]